MSRRRSGVPVGCTLMMVSPMVSGLGNSPIVRTIYSIAFASVPISIVPAGRFKLLALSARLTAPIGNRYALSLSASTSIQISLSRSPAICTDAMFLMSRISSFRFSAIVRIRVSEIVPPTTIVNIGKPAEISNSVTFGSSSISSGSSLTCSTAARRF